MAVEEEKALAAEAAADLVVGGMVVGLGTGSTVGYLLPALGARRLLNIPRFGVVLSIWMSGIQRSMLCRKACRPTLKPCCVRFGTRTTSNKLRFDRPDGWRPGLSDFLREKAAQACYFARMQPIWSLVASDRLA